MNETKTKLLYFRDLNPAEVAEVVECLNTIAAGLGYVSKVGPMPGQGTIAAMLVGIARGEVVVRRPD